MLQLQPKDYLLIIDNQFINSKANYKWIGFIPLSHLLGSLKENLMLDMLSIGATFKIPLSL